MDMEAKKVFCEECRNDVNYIIEETQMVGTIKGEIYQYRGKVARCVDCQCEIYVAEVHDYNLKALYDEYRKQNDIISLEHIREICEKYAIGKRPLSLLLGWGEQTFSRYYEGDIPTKQYSNTLKKIYEDPNFYYGVLNENKNNLKLEQAYKKSKAAVELLMGRADGENKKINHVIKYLLSECEDITPLALQKLLYYVQGFYYAFHEKFLFEEDCQAWVHGPVYPEVYHRYKEYLFNPIDTSKEVEFSEIIDLEDAIIDSVIKYLGCYSGKVLERFTHTEQPWLAARGEYRAVEISNEIICKEDIGSYFKHIKSTYNMSNPSDIKLYAESMFTQLYGDV